MDKLIKIAVEARKMAYAPYSQFRVGAAIETVSGRIYTGCNIENASYGLTICAERAAIFKAVSDGAHRFKRMALVTGERIVSAPCGACRQVLAEFNPNLAIILASADGKVKKTNLSRLFPKPFILKK